MGSSSSLQSCIHQLDLQEAEWRSFTRNTCEREFSLGYCTVYNQIGFVDDHTWTNTDAPSTDPERDRPQVGEDEEDRAQTEYEKAVMRVGRVVGQVPREWRHKRLITVEVPSGGRLGNLMFRCDGGTIQKPTVAIFLQEIVRSVHFLSVAVTLRCAALLTQTSWCLL